MKRRHTRRSADFVSHRDSRQDKGYEPLELAKKGKPKTRKSKKSEYICFNILLGVHVISFLAEEYMEL